MKLRDALKGKLTEFELKDLKSAHDTVGSIAILDIPKSLTKKEKIIAKELMKLQPAIKTVCKKIGIHGGEFRTQKLKVIGGKKTKETEYIENNTRLLLDVEKVYFSPRLSTERKRINEQIKDGEEVLVMFSGCGPYVFNITKNTGAADVYGIEINPIAHKYALINKGLNKAYNAHVMKGDVKKIIPDFYKYVIGLKSSDITEQLKSRIIEHPRLMEFHLFTDDLKGKNKIILEKKIEQLKKKSIEVFVHMPFRIKERRIDLTRKDVTEEFAMLRTLGDLCKKHKVHAIVHISVHFKEMTDKFSKKRWIDNLLMLKKYFNYFYFENIYNGPFSTAKDIINLGKETGFRNVCIDLAHLYKQYKNNDKIIKDIKLLKKNFNTYFHVSDSNGPDEAVEVGRGKINFKKILPLVNQGIVEVSSKNETHGIEMLKSYKKIEHKHKFFDRILMPLPKSAENFLETALKVSKKGTFIHFYDFQEQKNFKKAEETIKKACKKSKKKCKILKTTKCGQYGPRKYRICVDFKVL
ncbi:hypothetical protein ACFLZ7_03425 [Nanoarchaeota archaeon]